jgi:hypothetical protein
MKREEEDFAKKCGVRGAAEMSGPEIYIYGS